MSLVNDASVAVQWYFGDERTTASDDVLDRVRTEGAHVPALLRWEMQNILLGAERALRDLPIHIDAPIERFFSGSEMQLARMYELTSYDAAYLTLAASLRLPLATHDGELAHAARDLGIEVLP